MGRTVKNIPILDKNGKPYPVKKKLPTPRPVKVEIDFPLIGKKRKWWQIF